MTQPYVDLGDMNRIGQCASPWPCFMMVASGNFSTQYVVIEKLSEGILAACQAVSVAAETINHIANMYHLEVDQVTQWYATVEWQTSPWLSKKMLNNVIDTLQRIDILEANPLSPLALCYEKAKLY